VSGVLLLVLLTVHMVAQHFVVSGGPRTYADVVAWIRNSAWPLATVLYGLWLLDMTAFGG
jgi:succinate dehydrogenase hydrophobic anchor subunit